MCPASDHSSLDRPRLQRCDATLYCHDSQATGNPRYKFMKTYRDHYFKRAKQEQYPARSVYKLQEIDKRFKLLSPGARVLDLGAAPGSWTLFAAKKVGPQGSVLAVDIQDIAEAAQKATGSDLRFPENVTLLQADVLENAAEFLEIMQGHAPFDVVLSDMAPKTTGQKFTDQARSMELAVMALTLAQDWLAPKGRLVTKVFMGPDYQEFVINLRALFTTVKNFKPQSSRSESKETFCIATGFKKGTSGSQ